MVDSGLQTLTLIQPSGSQRTIVRDRNDFVEVTRLDEAGIYQLRDQDTRIDEFAVNFFDPEESDLSRLTSERRDPLSPAKSTWLRVDDPYSWLLAAAILLILAVMLTDL